MTDYSIEERLEMLIQKEAEIDSIPESPLKYCRLEVLALEAVDLLRYDLQPGPKDNLLETLKRYATKRFYLHTKESDILDWPIKRLNKHFSIDKRTRNAINYYLRKRHIPKKDARVRDILTRTPKEDTKIPLKQDGTNAYYLPFDLMEAKYFSRQSFRDLYRTLINEHVIEHYHTNVEICFNYGRLRLGLKTI